MALKKEKKGRRPLGRLTTRSEDQMNKDHRSYKYQLQTNGKVCTCLPIVKMETYIFDDVEYAQCFLT